MRHTETWKRRPRREAVTRLEDHAENGAGRNLEAFAAEALPKLHRHLDKAKVPDAKQHRSFGIVRRKPK